jgi:hypothetical protein
LIGAPHPGNSIILLDKERDKQGERGKGKGKKIVIVIVIERATGH